MTRPTKVAADKTQLYINLQMQPLKLMLSMHSTPTMWTCQRGYQRMLADTYGVIMGGEFARSRFVTLRQSRARFDRCSQEMPGVLSSCI